MPRSRILKDKTKDFRMTCQKCGQKLPLTKYYHNNGNKRFYFHDCWCRICVAKYVKDLNSLKEYIFCNNREFNSLLWENATKVADDYMLSDDKCKNLTDIDQKQKFWFKKARTFYFKQMNLSQYYSFHDNTVDEEVTVKTEEQKMLEIKKKQLNQEIAQESRDIEKVYSTKWNGYFSNSQIRWLDNYYSKICNQFDISDAHIDDNVKKVAKAALLQDDAYNRVLRKEPHSMEEYRQITDIYNKLSDEAKLSAKSRTENDQTGFGSLGVLIQKMETSGADQFIVQRKFPKDDIDNILDDFRHITSSMDGETFGNDS